MQLTSTEKLLVAMAYGLYGEDKMDQIHTYLRCNGVDFPRKVISQTHTRLQEESQVNGYSDIVAYCEDERYFKALEMYKEYKRKMYEVLEGGSVEEYSVSSSEEECELGVESYRVTKKKVEVVLGTLTGLGSVKVKNETQLQIEPKTINRVVSRTSKADGTTKDKKRFYWKLTEEEKAMDDYFDLLDGRVEALPKGENDYYRTFPALNGLKRENRDNSSLEVSDGEIEEILAKISKEKKVEKDKSQWRGELRVLQEYIKTVVKKKGDKIEMNSLSQSVLLILLELQDVIVESEDSETIGACGILKKYVGTFHDFYRK